MSEMEIDLKHIIATQSKKFVREFSKVVMILENALIPDDRIENTPSMADGLSQKVENDLRIWGCEMIQTAGILLNLPQVSMATGQVLFQRFFYSKSFVKHNYEMVAMACIALASKIEEAPRRVRDVANVFHHIKQIKNKKSISTMILDSNYVELKNQVIKSERRILKELGFAVHVKHPHKIIVMFLQVLECEKNQHLIQCAWNYMNDSFRTNVFVRFTPETIAAACVYLAARQLKICLPNRPHWFLLFGIREENMRTICKDILQLYTRSKANVEDLEMQVADLRARLVELKLKEKQERVELREAAAIASVDAKNNSPQPIIKPIDNKSRNKRSRSRSRTPTAYKKPKRDDHKKGNRNRDHRSSSSNLSSSNNRRLRKCSPSAIAKLVHQNYLKSSSSVVTHHHNHKSPKKVSPPVTKNNASRHTSHERSKDKYDKYRVDKIPGDKYMIKIDADKYSKYHSDKISDKATDRITADKHTKYQTDKMTVVTDNKVYKSNGSKHSLHERSRDKYDKYRVDKIPNDKYMIKIDADKYSKYHSDKISDKVTDRVTDRVRANKIKR